MSSFSSLRPSPFHVAGQGISRPLTFGILSTYPPTLCGLATFSAALADGLTALGSDVAVVRVADGSPSESDRVAGEVVNGSQPSRTASAELLNQNDVAIIQHGYGIYGGTDGDDIVEIIGGLRVPSIVIAHNVLKGPTRHQRSVLESVVALADRVVVMSEAARKRLSADYDVDRHKVLTIPHGATVPKDGAHVRRGRPTLVTWGLLGPGKGIERVIEAMRSLRELPGRPLYVVAGRTHPKVSAADGEAYRDELVEQAQRSGVADAVSFDPGYRNPTMLSALAQSAAVVVLP